MTHMNYFPREERDSEQRVIQLLQAKTPGWRMRKAFSLSATTRRLAESNIRAENPEASEREVRLARAERAYGRELMQQLGVLE